jgi:hypothetical protein
METQAVSARNSVVERYEPLRAYLAGLPKEQYHIELTFAQIEELIGEPLPAEASDFAWWHVDEGGPKTPQSRAWVEAGFGVTVIAPSDRSGWVSFARGLHRWPGVGVASREFGQLPAAERLRQLAIGYLESGKLLCINLGENPNELTWPRAAVVCFCYRHAVELFVKSCILHREPVEKCDHNISSLQKQYLRVYPEPEFHFQTPFDFWDIVEDLEEQFGRPVIDIEDFERKEDQVYRYYSDKQGRSPKGWHMFGPGAWFSMIERLECDMKRIWERVRALDSRT